jgi:hypothetical protein
MTALWQLVTPSRHWSLQSLRRRQSLKLSFSSMELITSCVFSGDFEKKGVELSLHPTPCLTVR